MRPLRLVMRAFGPYAGEQVLDFADLGDRSFFLIHGPTGSGKTSVLDATCYALYGETSGDGREGWEMRSHHAPPEVKTEVVFEFALGDRAYRVTRSPEWERPKLRGEGYTTEPAAAALEELGPPPGRSLPIAGIRAVTARVEELLGFRSEEFRQVIVLPQGRFREFLEAETTARQAILETLFRTAFYRDIEAALKERKAVLERELEETRRRRSDVLREYEVSDEDGLAEKLSRLRRQLDFIQAQAERARRQTREAEARLDEAGEVVKAASGLQEAEADLARKKQERELAGRELSEAGAALEQERARDPERERAAALLHRLGQIGEKRDALDSAVVEFARARADLAGRTTELEQAGRECTALRESLHDLERAHREASELSGQKELWEARSRELQKTLNQSAQLSGLRAEMKEDAELLATLKADEEGIRRELERARTESEELIERWRRNQAAVMARTLEPGRPCPVCGSLDHPAPAVESTGDVPTEEELKLAAACVRELEARREKVRQRVATADGALQGRRSTVKTLEEGLGEAAASGEEDLKGRAEEVGRHLREAAAAGEKAQALVGEVEAATKALKEAEDRLERLRAAHRKAELKAGALEATVREREADIPEQWRDREAFEKALAAAGANSAALTGALEEAQNRVNKARERQAGAGEAERGAMDAVARARRRLEESRGLLVEGLTRSDWDGAAALRLAEGITDDDLQRLRDLREAWDDYARGLAGEAGSLTRELERAAKHAAELEDLRREFERLENAYNTAAHLADVATGHNRLGVSLERFVLVALLDDVLEAATRRLRLMSRGRYHLQRVLKRSDGRRHSGLDLEVYDTYTGTTRSVRTLSGGEGFLASLSLALGLADVVQSRAGGLRLETIFIDEGFGSLDPESLDLAIRALLDLQQGGRLVGIISHVPELAERIDARLEIAADRRGSAARFVVG